MIERHVSLRAGALAAVAVGIGILACDVDETQQPAVGSAPQSLVCGPPVSVANALQIHFDIPDALSSYTGTIPVTFGVPFPRGELHQGKFIGLYQQSGAQECELPLQYRVTARWHGPTDGSCGPGAETTEIKWLLVDATVEMVNGDIQPVFLKYDDALAEDPPNANDFSWTTGFAARVAQSGGPPTSALDDEDVGRFLLKSPAYVDPFIADEVAPSQEVVGAVRRVLKVEGNYRRANQVIGEFKTRYAMWSGLPFVRIHHTMVWGRDDTGTLPPANDLSHPLNERADPNDPNSAFDYEDPIDFLAYEMPVVAASGCEVGLATTGSVLNPSCTPLRVRQDAVNAVRQIPGGGTPTVTSDKLTGWFRSNDSSGSPHFVGLRWASEQFPSAFDVNAGVAQVRLLDANGLGWNDLATNADTAGNNGSPVGVAKTYEIWLWPGGAGTPSAAIQNAFAQGGVYAYADPDFAVRAEIPSPMSANHVGCDQIDPDTSEVALVERAICDLFTFATRERNPGASDNQTRLGAIHFGDLINTWDRNATGYTQAYRYWMNTGTGYPVLPWMLWMRSGWRAYRDFAEANVRHVMDVDTAHVSRWVESVNPKLKLRGAQAQYDARHGAFQSVNGDMDRLTKTNDSEAIALAYYLTGYERALDVLVERADAFNRLADPSPPTSYLDTDLLKLTDPSSSTYPYGFVPPSGSTAPGGDGPQNQYRTTAELLILHEALGEGTAGATAAAHVGDAACDFLDAILDLRQDDDWFLEYGAKPNWFEHGLFTAERVFPDKREVIRDSLARWDEYHGSASFPGGSGKASAPKAVPHALSAMLARFDATGDARALARAQSVAYTQALSVHDAASAPGNASIWIGMSAADEMTHGAVVRDWLAVLARQSPTLPFAPDLAPKPFFSRPSAGKERLYVVKDIDEDLHLGIDLNFYNGGVGQREVAVAAHAPDGSSHSEVFCTVARKIRFFHDFFGWDPSGPGETCPSANAVQVLDESFVYDLDASMMGMGGVFGFDVTIGGGYLNMFADPLTVRSASNSALAFSGASTTQIADSPRLHGRNKMTLAFRVGTTTTAVQTVFTKTSEYLVYTHSGNLYVRYYIDNDGPILLAERVRPLPINGTLYPVVTTLHIDERTGVVTSELCVASDCESGQVAASPKAAIWNLTHPLFLGRQAGSFLFNGTLDDLRILDRVLSPREKQAFMIGGSWTVNTRDVAGGEVFLFDGAIEGLSGTSYSVTTGGFAFQSQPTPTKIARPAKLVHYDPAAATCTSLNSGSNCRRFGAQSDYYGALYGRANAGVVNVSVYGDRWDRFTLASPSGDLHHAMISGAAPPAVSEASNLSTSLSTTPGELYAIVYGAAAQHYGMYHLGFDPLFARSPQAWFDALACEEHATVAAFGPSASATGSIAVPSAALGNARTVSFKMFDPDHQPSGARYLVNKPYEFRAYELAGSVYFEHYLSGASGPLVLATTYPTDQWLTVTSTAELVGGVVYGDLWINGRLVQELAVSATGFNQPVPQAVRVGRSVDGGGEISFDGWLDDLQVRNSIVTPVDSWFECGPTSLSGFAAYESFESCPTGQGTFSLVRRDGTSPDCPP